MARAGTLTIRPADGGQLITRADATDAGVAHYVKKINMRRDSSDEMRREGHDYYVPLPDDTDAQVATFAQSFIPASSPITLIHIVRRQNGEAVAIVGTKTTLYRFNLSLLGYFENPLTGLSVGDSDPTLYASGVSSSPYFEVPTRWEIIGSGFSANGKRWEAVDINGTTIINNSVDLPVAYRVEWREVVPLYELRDQGIICVGTICQSNGILLCMDVTELQETDIPRVLNCIRSDAVLVGQSGYRHSGSISATASGTTVTASANFFEAADVGRTLMWWDGKKYVIHAYSDAKHVTLETSCTVTTGMTFQITDLIGDTSQAAYEITSDGDFFTTAMVGLKIGWKNGQVRKIISRVSARKVTTDYDGPVTAAEAFIENPYAYAGKEAIEAAFPGIKFNQYQWRVLGSEIGDGQKFAVIFDGTVAAGSQTIEMLRCNRSLTLLDAVAVTGAGTSGGTLLTDTKNNPVVIESVGPGFIRLILPAVTGGDIKIQRASSIGSTSCYYDLTDDGAGILKAAVLQSRVVVYTDSNIFLGRYTGSTDNPWEWEMIVVPHGRSLHYRNTLVCIGGSVHVYAGKTQFYQFELTSRLPSVIQAADLVSNIFYDYASLANTESIYASDNHLTQEVWIVSPANTMHPVLCYDYVKGTFSTMDWAPTACPTVKEVMKPLVGATPDMFLMGTSVGVVLQYGLSTEAVEWWDDARAIWYRREARPYTATKSSYTFTLKSGLNAFGDLFNEKSFQRYCIQLSSLQPTAPAPGLAVSFYSAFNPNSVEYFEGAESITDLANHGMVPLDIVSTYASDEISGTGQYPLRIHSRSWEGRGIKSGSIYKAS